MKKRAIVALLLVWFVIGCGSVSSSPLASDAGGGAGGQVDAGDRGGAAGGGRGGGAGELGGQGGAGGQVDAGCVDYTSGSVEGFAFNGGCDGEAPADPDACHASCELRGRQFVGCIVGSPIATRCYAACSDCP